MSDNVQYVKRLQPIINKLLDKKQLKFQPTIKIHETIDSDQKQIGSYIHYFFRFHTQKSCKEIKDEILLEMWNPLKNKSKKGEYYEEIIDAIHEICYKNNFQNPLYTYIRDSIFYELQYPEILISEQFLNKVNITQSEIYVSKYGINGIIDLIINDNEICDIKWSTQTKNIQTLFKQSYTQLLLYYILLQNYKIKYLSIYNPHFGEYIKCEINQNDVKQINNYLENNKTSYIENRENRQWPIIANAWTYEAFSKWEEEDIQIQQNTISRLQKLKQFYNKISPKDVKQNQDFSVK